MKKVTITMIHTVFPIVQNMSKLFQMHLGNRNAEIYNIVDDSIIPRIIEDGSINKDVIRTVYEHICSAANFGSDIVLVTCSSITEVVDVVCPLVSLPIVKIDDAMTDEAVKVGNKIGVIATVNTTLEPTIKQLKKKAAKYKKNITIKPCFCPDAYDHLMKENDREVHDSIILKKMEELYAKVDTIVFAQASLSHLKHHVIKNVEYPVLTSPEGAVKRVIDLAFN